MTKDDNVGNAINAEALATETALSFIDEIKAAAENAQNLAGFIYEPTSGLYYDSKTGYYYNAVSDFCQNVCNPIYSFKKTN